MDWGSPRGALTALHWPFQLGYFVSLVACAPQIATVSVAASASAPVEIRYNMMILHALSGRLLDRRGRTIHAAPGDSPRELTQSQ
jgi:hypothetical protein